MSVESSEVPGLADTIAAVRAELRAAQRAGSEEDLQFRLGDVEIELGLEVGTSVSGEGGVRVWVVNAGASAERTKAATHTLRLTLTPVTRGGEDVLCPTATERAPGRAAPSDEQTPPVSEPDRGGLEPWRFVKVLAPDAEGRRGAGGFGSGYVIAEGLVLTAAHVVGGAPRVQVRTVHSDWVDADVAFVRAPPAGPDLALLRVAESSSLSSLPAPGGPAPVGRVVGSRPVGFAAVGFPLVQATTAAAVTTRDSEHVVGFLAPLTGLESGMITLHAATSAPQPLPDGRSPWAGMSGAAVLVSGTVVGVVVHDPVRFGTDRLVAQPLAPLPADRGGGPRRRVRKARDRGVRARRPGGPQVGPRPRRPGPLPGRAVR